MSKKKDRFRRMDIPEAVLKAQLGTPVNDPLLVQRIYHFAEPLHDPLICDDHARMNEWKSRLEDLRDVEGSALEWSEFIEFVIASSDGVGRESSATSLAAWRKTEDKLLSALLTHNPEGGDLPAAEAALATLRDHLAAWVAGRTLGTIANHNRDAIADLATPASALAAAICELDERARATLRHRLCTFDVDLQHVVHALSVMGSLGTDRPRRPNRRPEGPLGRAFGAAGAQLVEAGWTAKGAATGLAVVSELHPDLPRLTVGQIEQYIIRRRPDRKLRKSCGFIMLS